MGPNYLLYLPSASQARSATAIHKATSCPAPCQSCVRSRSAVVRGRSDAPGKSTESTRSLAPSAQRLLQSCLSCSCQLPTRRNAVISIYRSSAALGMPCFTHAPRHTGTHRHTPARSPAHKYTGCCRVIPSFLHLPPPACFSAGCFKNSKNSKSRTEIKNRKLKLAALVLPVRSAARCAAAERCPTKRTARSNGSSKRSKRSERSASPTQHRAPQLQRPLPRHQPSGAP